MCAIQITVFFRVTGASQAALLLEVGSSVLRELRDVCG